MTRLRILVLLALCLAWTDAALTQSEPAPIRDLRAKERKSFTDAELTEGFLKIAIGAEMHRGGRVDRIRKYVEPVRVFIDNRAKPDRTAMMERVVADIAKSVSNLDIAMAKSRADANVVITLVRDRDLGRTIRAFYGAAQGKRIMQKLEPQCLSSFRKDDAYRIRESNIILAADVDDFTFLDCAYEETLQALGPINDVDIPWTMFNDDVQMGFFGTYDRYIVNMLYDPAIRPGMRASDVRAVLPGVIARVRRLSLP